MTLTDGRTAVADEAYFRRALFDPAADLAAGYTDQMASYRKFLSDSEVDALLAFYKALAPLPEESSQGDAVGRTDGGPIRR